VKPELLTVREVADLFGVSRMTVYRLIEDQSLRARRIGRSLRIDMRDAKEFWQDANTIEWERPA
jgi:excisionase family DNA binding protein